MLMYEVDRSLGLSQYIFAWQSAVVAAVNLLWHGYNDPSRKQQHFVPPVRSTFQNARCSFDI